MLTFGGLDGRILDYAAINVVDWVEYLLNFLDKNAFEDFIVVLRNIWNAHNNSIFRGLDEEAGTVWEHARSLEGDFFHS